LLVAPLAVPFFLIIYNLLQCKLVDVVEGISFRAGCF